MTKLQQAQDKILDAIIQAQSPENIEQLVRSYMILSSPVCECMVRAREVDALNTEVFGDGEM